MYLSLFFILSLVIIQSHFVTCFPDEKFRIATIFDETSNRLKQTFKAAVQLAEKDRNGPLLTGVQVDLKRASLHGFSQVCDWFGRGVATVIGLQKHSSQVDISSICDALEIPYLQIHPVFVESSNDLSVSLYPDSVTLSNAFFEMLKYWGWNIFTILYEADEELLKFRQILRQSSGFTVTVRQLQGPNYHPVLKEIQRDGETKILLDCSTASVYQLLRQAQQLKLMTSAFQYMLTTMDVHTINLSTFVHDRAKITSFRLIDPESTETTNFLSQRLSGATNEQEVVTTEEALLHDAVLLVKETLKNSATSAIQQQPASCDQETSWGQGTEFFNLISQTEVIGLSGFIQFDAHNSRTNFSLAVVQVGEDKLEKIGTWNTAEGVIMGEKMPTQLVAGSIKGKKLRAITVIEEPYVMLKSDHESRIGNDKFEGYAVDLMNRIADELGFNFTLENKVGLGHGVLDLTTNEWNGLIRELIDKRGDIAVGGITISYNRERVVDFTKPFMHLGISILFRKPEAKPPDLFSFLHPFTADVWLYILVAGSMVAATIFVLARFSPYEWYNPHPCDENSDIVENQFTVGNCLWFTIGSIMQQGSDITPRAVSTRTVAGSWWFFTLIMIASYTANLAAFLAVERTDQAIKSADDLAKQTEIKYGCYKGGATYNFFKGSKHPVYQKMWSFMNLEMNNFVTTGSEGIRKVKTEKYAYLMESPSLEYNVNQNCELTQVGGLLDSKGFGLATQQNSPYRDEISRAILRMQENSELEVLKDKWWKGKNQVCSSSKQDTNSELGLANVGGVFVILAGGIILSFVVAAVEFSWKLRKAARISKRPFWKEFRKAFMKAVRSNTGKNGNDCL